MRLIDADALMKELEREVELADDWKTAHEIVNVVKYFPTIEPEQKKGKWLSHYGYCKRKGYTPSGLSTFWWCNQCEQGVEYPTNFCPNCGAKMEVER